MPTRSLHILLAHVAAGVALALLLRLLGVAAAQPWLDSGQGDTVSYIAAAPTGDTGSEIPVIIYLRESADLESLARIDDPVAHRRQIVQALQATAADSQALVIGELDRLKAEGLVQQVQSLWIVNAIAATVSREAIPSLASLQPVERVEIDRVHQAFDDPTNENRQAGLDSAGFAGWASPEAKPLQATNWSIARVRAPYVWNLLGIDGAGITVAIVDTGVDWQHPALRSNYRGGQGEAAQHAGNWYSTVYPTQTVPIDLHGHGTHVAGTAVGSRGIGVAPGAKWIAVGIADENGRIRDSDVHLAFQWLLAPNGLPELAPDVVNNSWGTAGDYTAFQEDVRALDAAGIITVFAAGNTGPLEGTINAPASYPGVISAGAEDSAGSVTWFSSRGPSPLTAEPKPLLAAPGAQILSAYPGNRYALFNGTSMATPHVTGAIALMLSAEPRLTAADVAARLQAAAGDMSHDPARGWGSLDVYAAVAPLAPAARLSGSVTGQNGPVPGAVITLTTPSGIELPFSADAQGRYEASLVGGHYRLQVSAFGYYPESANVEVEGDHVVYRDVSLRSRPVGTISLRLGSLHAGQTAEGAITIRAGREVVPAVPVSGDDGRLTYDLPADSYTLEARLPGYRLQTVPVEVEVGAVHPVDIDLTSGPRLLLIDSGAWQYRSQATYYERALSDLGLFADHWTITNPYDPLPGLERLKKYDAVLWTAPTDSPGYLGANDVITDYLGIGGKLLIAGQNIGNYDGAQGSLAIWWARNLEARWLADGSPEQLLSGATNTPFAGLTINLNGADSARNQVAPDRVVPRDSSLTQPMILYPDGTAAALLSNRCKPYRLLYMGFGLEGVTGQADRAALLQAALDALLGPEDIEAALWQPAEISDYALSGEQQAYTVTLRNLNRALTQTFDIQATGGLWPRSILSPTLQIPPCEAADTVVSLSIPTDLARDQMHEMFVTAEVNGDSAQSTALTFTHKSPGTILLVDDDRFVNAEAIYEEALDHLGLPYDIWKTGWQNDGRGSPTLGFLRAYDLVIWFTGYDWFQPITPAEGEVIAEYLNGGGRLFLSSQDFLYRNFSSSLAKDYLGVVTYQESITPTMAFLDEGLGALPEIVGALPLDYGVYQNFSDGLIPAAQAVPFLWHNQGSLAGVATSGAGAGGEPWRSVFWALPFEALPAEQRAAALASVLGQLSDAGDSRFTVDRRSGPSSEPRVYSLTVVNSDSQPRHLWVTNTLPAELTLLDGSTEFTHDRAGRRLRWDGILEPRQSRTLHYSAALPPSAANAQRIDNSVLLRSAPLPNQGTADILDEFVTSKTATTWVDAPDLSTSRLLARSAVRPATASAEPEPPIQVITYSLVMRNSGVVATAPMSATISMPHTLGVLENSLSATNGELHVEAWRAIWSGILLPGEMVTASLALTQTVGIADYFPAVAYLYDQASDPVLRAVTPYTLPYRAYIPQVAAWP